MESLLLDKIDQPSDLKKLNAQQVENFAQRYGIFCWKISPRQVAIWPLILAP